MNDKLVKQNEGFPMGGAKSVIMPGIHMKTMEKNCVAPLNSKLCKHYVADDTITTRKKNATNDKLFANMKLTVESSTTRFLDTTFNVNPDDSVTTKSFENLENFQPFGTFKYLKSTRGII